MRALIVVAVVLGFIVGRFSAPGMDTQSIMPEQIVLKSNRAGSTLTTTVGELQKRVDKAVTEQNTEEAIKVIYDLANLDVSAGILGVDRQKKLLELVRPVAQEHLEHAQKRLAAGCSGDAGYVLYSGEFLMSVFGNPADFLEHYVELKHAIRQKVSARNIKWDDENAVRQYQQRSKELGCPMGV